MGFDRLNFQLVIQSRIISPLVSIFSNPRANNITFTTKNNHRCLIFLH